ncbi:helix-turn-helix domain-containing protein [Neisseria animalis]|uniref:XRE family transcriptional regulator n=1 Tax=Neisseria animalis TaxID=492 RepID=A0A5P3MUA1_NEIAN|nr:helix-turn-helix transcriptional regulator [Neisseria animalis]QEY24239.1 XRE family transcriptional regulator [Neisseria animalis]ROW32356.1 XRE family transcriptional regulator [Neisseria animalis]VEE06591.1 putative DNA-binding protein [Neisseria animalis]
MMETYEIIRALREDRNWSQKDMAEKLHMSVNGYAKIERGENSVNMFRLEQIAEVLEVDIHELIPISENHPMYFIIKGDRNISGNGNTFYQGQQELAVEIDKLKQTLTHKEEIISRLESELATLKKVMGLMQQDS